MQTLSRNWEDTLMMPYRVRPVANNSPWQQYYISNSKDEKLRDGFVGLRFHDSTTLIGFPFYGFPVYFTFPEDGVVINVLLDEKNKKMYFIHSFLDADFLVRQGTVVMDENSNRVVDGHTALYFLGHFGFKPPIDHMIQWFLNPFDGSIFQIHSSNDKKGDDVTSFHTVSWVKLDENVEVKGEMGENCDGEVTLMAQYQLEFPRLNIVDLYECGIQFSENGKKLLMRFRMSNPKSYTVRSVTYEIKNVMSDPDHPFTHYMTMAPTYAIFALDYDSHRMQLVTQFVPSSQEIHADLLISAKLLPSYGNAIGLPNSAARSFLSQRSLMIGQQMKYTFFSTVRKHAIAIVAVKSFTKILQNGQFSSAPKKVWIPLEDDRVKTAFKSLPDKNIKWEMLSYEKNVMLVFGGEFVLEIFDPDKELKLLGTIRVKLGVEFKDYRECAGCGKVEVHKRKNKNGKRISQFKVCGWCKDHNLHKMWFDIPCHYCSDKCADKDWSKHKLQHEQQQNKGKKAKGKKKKSKK